MAWNLKVADKRGVVNPWMQYIFKDTEYSILGENFLTTAFMTLYAWFLVAATKKEKRGAAFVAYFILYIQIEYKSHEDFC